MKGTDWLDEIERRLADCDAAIELSRPDPGSLTVACGSRGAVVLDRGAEALVTLTRSGGTTIASRLKERVSYDDARPFACESSSIEPAIAVILEHLLPPV